MVQQWSVTPAAMAGVVLCAGDKLAGGVQKLYPVPTTNIPSCNVRVWRASARQRREAFPECRVEPVTVDRRIAPPTAASERRV